MIQIAHDISEEHISASDFVEIILSQTVSYVAGAVGWIFAERVGFAAYACYMLDFARCNRFQTALLADAGVREQLEPFLTSETFDIGFDLIYNLRYYLRLSFQLLFNALVLGFERFAACLRYRIRRSGHTAVAAEKTARGSLSAQPADDQPHAGAQLQRLGQGFQWQPLQLHDLATGLSPTSGRRHGSADSSDSGTSFSGRGTKSAAARCWPTPCTVSSRSLPGWWAHGGNGTGRSTLLSALECQLRGKAYY